ncbi:MAG: hypothetical protein G01um101425_829 [Candidatus Peregrinibacteria bacterium Gr01-1014_25]|nr:MAG: hypothetical protein G01um101425_829 [Candidatus Peregrinibacteria bacterium Gr01-1014_25]
MSLFLRLALLGLLILPEPAAAYIPVPNCLLPFLPCGDGGVEGLNAYFWNTAFPFLRVSFVGIALLMFVYYGIQLMLARQQESVQSEAKSAYEMAIFGCVLVMLASMIVETFTPGIPGAFIKPEPLITGLTAVIFYFKAALTAVVIMRITIQGVRLVLLEGQAEGEMEKQKKQFFNSLLGVGLVLLANAIVAAAYPGARSGILATEIVGFANFLLVLAGGAAVLAFIAAGVMMIVSFDESLKDRAKKTMFTTVLAIVVILTSYVLVNYFLAL